MSLRYFEKYARKRWQAEDWYILNQKPDISEEDRLEFLAWIESDPRHEQEYARVETVSSLMSTAATGLDGSLPQAGRKSHRKPLYVAVASAAACALLVAILLVTPFDTGVESYQTAIGEQRVVTLADGSILRLNTSTHAKIDFNKTQRLIELNEGEAFFDVQKDPNNRPFLVVMDGTIVKAVGTEFNIRLSNESMTVSVVEGLVEILRQETPSAAQTKLSELSEGFKVTLTRSGSSEVLKSPETNNVTSWTNGWSDFSGSPLEAVVREVNRYSETQIRIADESLASIPIEVRFMIGKPDEFAQAIAAVYPIEVIKENNEIVLQVKP